MARLEQGAALIRAHWPILLLGAVTYVVTRYSVTYGAGSDPRYTLIVSQAILEHGTIRLNAYQDDEIWGAPAAFDEDLNVLEYDGRYYNYFPVGPSIVSLPFVAMARAAGWDMRLARDNVNAQRLLSSLSAVSVLWLVYAIVRVYLEPRPSLAMATVSVFGTSLISTLGVAWWSFNPSVLFIGLGLLLLARYDGGKSADLHPIWLGGLLFLAFFMRASAAAFIAAVFLYLLSKDRRLALWTGASAGALLALFLLWSRLEFDTWLPIYYSAARLQVDRGPLWLALYGQLFSPARGLFVYSPFFLLLIPGLWLLRRSMWQRPLLWMCLVWLGLHLLTVARSTSWWGGHSFGPRILTEPMLALTLLTGLLWQQAQSAWRMGLRRLFAASYLLLGAAGIGLHTYQGLYNASTAVWNAVASETPAPPFTPPLGDLFNWRDPQFLATNGMLCELEAERVEAMLAQAPMLGPFPWGRPIPFDPAWTGDVEAVSARLGGTPTPPPQRPALFVGWEPVDNDRAPHRATYCDTVHFLFWAEEVESGSYTLVIRSAAFGRQRARISLNGHPAGEWLFTQQPRLAPETAALPLSNTWFLDHAVNDLTIDLPDARRASYRDPIRLALAVADITICPPSAAGCTTELSERDPHP